MCGVWGVLSTSIFQKEKGIIYSSGGWKLLGIQIVGCAVIILWSTSLSYIYFSLVRKFGKLRLTEQQELLGGDILYFAPKVMAGKISSYT